MSYYLNGQKAELEFKCMMESYGRHCKLKSDVHSQYKDIDLVMFSPNWESNKTISVKEQLLADQYQTFLFETKQVRTLDGESINGNVQQCEAELYAVCSPSTWMVLDVVKLKDLIMDNTWEEQTTSLQTEELNRKYKGPRCYDRTINSKIPFESLRASDAFIWECER